MILLMELDTGRLLLGYKVHTFGGRFGEVLLHLVLPVDGETLRHQEVVDRVKHVILHVV